MILNLKTIFFTAFMLFLCSAFAQEQGQDTLKTDIFSKLQRNQRNQGEILISQDIRVNELIVNHIEQNKRKGGIPGYSIRIYSNLGNTARVESQSTKARFYELFPEIPIYREYDSPYFKVYVGDFRTKIDALADFKRIKRHFPSAFIVPYKINYPVLEE